MPKSVLPVEAKEQQQDPFVAIEALMSWEAFVNSVVAARRLDQR